MGGGAAAAFAAIASARSLWSGAVRSALSWTSNKWLIKLVMCTFDEKVRRTPSLDAGLSQLWMTHLPYSSPSFTTISMKGAYVIRLLAPAFKTSRPSTLRVSTGPLSLLSYQSIHAASYSWGRLMGAPKVRGLRASGATAMVME